MTRKTVISLLVVVCSLAVATSGLAATYQVTVLDGSQYGWLTFGGSQRCWGAKPAGISWYNEACYSNPGPAPGANLGFNCPENGSMGGTDQPGQVWAGTNRYVGLKLRDIRKINYWAIVDWRGVNTFPLLDNNGNDVYNTAWDPRPAGYPAHWHEYRVQSVSSQPPAILLTVKINQAGDQLTMLYRPWNQAAPGQGIRTTNFNPPAATRVHRVWTEYTAVDTIDFNSEGYWYVVDDLTSPDGDHMWLWEEILNQWPDAELVTPTVNLNPVFAADPVQAPIACSFNLHLGALANTNNHFQAPYTAWWYESYWARGAADLVTVVYDSDPSEAGENLVTETFDFERTTRENTSIPLYVPQPKVRALNNLAIFDQKVYMPLPRSRASANPSEPLPWGQGTIITAGNYPWNAVQRYGHYGTSTQKSAGVAVPNSTVANLFAVYGEVCSDPAPDGNFFWIDDGAGKKVKCYCPDLLYNTQISPGAYLRLVGSAYGNNPYEWYWNQFHIVQFKDTYPFDCQESQPWPWEFHTYPWNVTVLKPAM